ncbi:MAG TPA: 4Fe-4S binding protein [Thermoanaerobaculia bacterium]|nr:4Fe-4S binding protein [Thermoanaerobaculia bacterium]
MITRGRTPNRKQTNRIAPPAYGWEAWLNGKMGRKGEKSYRIRIAVQTFFALTCVVLGVQFARFVSAAQAGRFPLPDRPAGVEGFLPISGLMGLVDWFYQGTLNTIHPAAAMLVLIGLAMAILLRKAFCSWVCPVGFVSELLARLGRRMFGRNFRIWRFLDVPLRGLKYLLLGFFLWAIFGMSAASLHDFLESPYNRLADIKMGLFFVHLGALGAWVLFTLAALSLLYKGFWCRYLCPYGALLGMVSWISPTRIRRDPVSCIDCGLCDRVCSARLPVSKKIDILNPECIGCMDCVAVCPVKDALNLQVGKTRVSAKAYAAAVLILFFAGYFGARVFGLWENNLTDAEYVQRIREDRTAPYAHPGM